MNFHKEIEQIHIYRKSEEAQPNLNTSEFSFEKFVYEVIEKSSPSYSITLGGKQVEIFRKGDYTIKKTIGSKYGLKEIWATGSILDGNSSGRFFRDFLSGRYLKDGYGVLYKVYGIGDDIFDYRYFTGPKREGATKGKYYQGVPLDKFYSDEIIRELPIENFYDLASNFGNCRQEGSVDFRAGKKPEILLKTILQHFSSEGDLVLDAFLGSGTTAAVAHKMKRRYIGIEQEETVLTHVLPRLKKVIDGEQGGISKAVNWTGGGNFKFFRLGEKLVDDDGIINPALSFPESAAYIWYIATKTPARADFDSPLLGIHDGKAIYYLHNEKLTRKTFEKLPAYDGEKIIYATARRIGKTFLAENKITFHPIKEVQ